uniref:Uncharacterized protein n=1 Tax=Anguilla anguilla TaxID=7936 RepID=A0A0E9X2S1_ANGAN
MILNNRTQSQETGITLGIYCHFLTTPLVFCNKRIPFSCNKISQFRLTELKCVM